MKKIIIGISFTFILILLFFAQGLSIHPSATKAKFIQYDKECLINIYRSCENYAKNHDGILPRDIETLVNEGYMDKKYKDSYGRVEEFILISQGKFAEKNKFEIMVIQKKINMQEPICFLLCDGTICFVEKDKIYEYSEKDELHGEALDGK